MKVTVPPGMPAPGATGATGAVKVTGCPNTAAAAVIGWPPVESDELVYEALLPLSATVASATPLSMKVTVPVGAPAPGDMTATVAVKVTDWPKTAVGAEEPRLTDVAACPTVSLSAAEA